MVIEALAAAAATAVATNNCTDDNMPVLKEQGEQLHTVICWSLCHRLLNPLLSRHAFQRKRAASPWLYRETSRQYKASSGLDRVEHLRCSILHKQDYKLPCDPEAIRVSKRKKLP